MVLFEIAPRQVVFFFVFGVVQLLTVQWGLCQVGVCGLCLCPCPGVTRSILAKKGSPDKPGASLLLELLNFWCSRWASENQAKQVAESTVDQNQFGL